MAMKRGAIVVNTSRGSLVDEVALLTALQAGHLSAGLDAYAEAPLPADHPLNRLPNVVLTPHLGFVVADVMTSMYAQSVENIAAYLDGAPMRVAVA